MFTAFRDLLSQSKISNPKSRIPARRRSTLRTRHSASLTVECLEQRTLLASFAASFGGANLDVVTPPAALDPGGNTYLTGSFRSQTDLATGAAIAPLNSAGEYDAYVAKYDSSGTLLWGRGFGGAGYDDGIRTAFAAEAGGEFVYVVGNFNGTANFGPGIGMLTSVGASDVFIVKLRADDGSAVWGKSVGGAAADQVVDLSVNGGNAHLVGSFRSSADFDPGSGTVLLTPTGSESAFVLSLDADGNFVTAWQIDGSDFSKAASIIGDASSLFVSGQFKGTADFDPGPGVANRTSAGDGSNWFLAKYTAAGVLEWVDAIGSNGNLGDGRRLGQDANAIYMVGEFSGSADFDPGSNMHSLVAGSATDAVVASYDKSDGGLRWVRQFGGSEGSENAYTSVVDEPTGSLFVSGKFSSASVDFHPSGPEGVLMNSNLSRTIGGDGFVLCLDAATGEYQAVWQLHTFVNSAVPFVYDVRDSHVYTAAYYSDVIRLPTGQSFTSAGSSDVLLMAFDHSAPQVSIDGVTRVEGNSGTTSFIFNVTRTGLTTSSAAISWATFDGTATAASGDYLAASGQITFAPGETSKTIAVSVVGDAAVELDETFTIRLSNALGCTIASGIGRGTILNDDVLTTKFYVADDGTTNKTFEYAANGTAIEDYTINSGNSAPRGAASTIAGDKVWVVDANKNVYVYNTSGGLLGTWSAGTLASNADVQGITTNGTDVWLVDAKQDKVFKYNGAATRTSGSQNAATSFSLNSSNTDPTDLVTDGTSIWVVNNSTTDKIFKYNASNGTLLGRWTIQLGGGSPTGITIDPSNVSNIWIVDASSDRIYEFTAATFRISGSQVPSTSYALSYTNTNPQGIADPPAPAQAQSASEGTGFRITSTSDAISHDAALISLSDELADLLSSGKKRK